MYELSVFLLDPSISVYLVLVCCACFRTTAVFTDCKHDRRLSNTPRRVNADFCWLRSEDLDSAGVQMYERDLSRPQSLTATDHLGLWHDYFLLIIFVAD